MDRLAPTRQAAMPARLDRRRLKGDADPREPERITINPTKTTSVPAKITFAGICLLLTGGGGDEAGHRHPCLCAFPPARNSFSAQDSASRGSR